MSVDKSLMNMFTNRVDAFRPRRDGMLVENASPTSQTPSREGRNVKIVKFNVPSLRNMGDTINHKNQINHPKITVQTNAAADSARCMVQRSQPAADSDRCTVQRSQPAASSDRCTVQRAHPAASFDRCTVQRNANRGTVII
ncbi:MAG: hypothetical protein LBD59_03145 [Prevotellaceae bacterium]|jgi:hypothetical protein|nr:hypothetical protein [Prevotellaceae bacterium]